MKESANNPKARGRILIYQKVFLLFVALILPVYLIGIRVILLGMKRIREEISRSLRSKIEFYARHLEAEISHIKTQQLQFINERDLQDVSFLSPVLNRYEEVSMINRIQDCLVTMKNSSAYIKDAGVFVSSLNKTLFLSNWYRDIPNTEYEIVRDYFSDTRREPLFYHKNRIFLMEAIPQKYGQSPQKKSHVSCIELSTSRMKEVLEKLSEYKNSGAFLYNEPTGVMISASSDHETPRSLIEESEWEQTKQTLFKDRIRIGRERYWLVASEVNYLDMTLFAYVPERQILYPLARYNFWFILFAFFSVIVIFLFALFINSMIHKPLKKFVEAFRRVEAEDFNVSIHYSRHDEFAYLYKSFDSFVERLKFSLQELYDQKLALQRSELKQLQSQINPHFLYNSFYHIYRMCKMGDLDNVSLIAQKLGSYFQFVTRSGVDEVPLFLEVQHLKDYIDIQQIRFGNRISAEFSQIPRECKDLCVPRLILQPIIENVYEHAFADTLEGGKVRIGLAYSGQQLSITVEDNGRGLREKDLAELQKKLQDPETTIQKTGIINVCQRLRFRYGTGSGVFASKSRHGGLKVELILNLLEERDGALADS